MKPVHYAAGALLVCAFAFIFMILLYGIGALLAYAINALIVALRNTTPVSAWQGMACLILGAIIYHFAKHK